MVDDACEPLSDPAELSYQALDGLWPDLPLAQRPGADIRGPDQWQEPRVQYNIIGLNSRTFHKCGLDSPPCRITQQGQ